MSNHYHAPADLPRGSERDAAYALLPAELSALAVTATDVGAHVVILTDDPTRAHLYIHRDTGPNSPWLALWLTDHPRGPVHVEYTDPYDAEPTTRHMTAPHATCLGVGVLIGWGLQT